MRTDSDNCCAVERAVGGLFCHNAFAKCSPVGAIAAVDPAGRALPHWVADCELSGDELFVGSTDSRSFDSRYFGLIHVDQVIGVDRKLTLGLALIHSRQSDSIAESLWLLNRTNATRQPIRIGRCNHPRPHEVRSRARWNSEINCGWV